MTPERIRELSRRAGEAGRHEEAQALAGLAVALTALERIRDDEHTPLRVRRTAAEAWAQIAWPDFGSVLDETP